METVDDRKSATKCPLEDEEVDFDFSKLGAESDIVIYGGTTAKKLREDSGGE